MKFYSSNIIQSKVQSDIAELGMDTEAQVDFLNASL